MAIYNVHTNIDPKEMHEALLETFKRWINFSLGIGKLGGHMLKNPSGRMASALRAEYNRDGEVVALYIDQEAEEQIKEGAMFGHKGFSLKRRMLVAGKKGVKRTKDGKYLYRYVPISNRPTAPKVSFENAINIKNMLTSKEFPSGGGQIRINRNLARMWTSIYKKGHGSAGGGKIRTMTNKPGSARWYIPAMPVFKAGKLLRDMLPAKMKDRVLI